MDYCSEHLDKSFLPNSEANIFADNFDSSLSTGMRVMVQVYQKRADLTIWN